MPDSRWPLPVFLVPPKGKMSLRADGRRIHVDDSGIQIPLRAEGIDSHCACKSMMTAHTSRRWRFRCASSKSSNGITDTTGPKISSCAIRIFGLQSTKMVGSWNHPLAHAVGLQAVPAARQLRAFAHADLDVLHHRLQLRLVDARPHVGTVGSSPSPTFSDFARATNRSTNSL